MLAQGPPAGAAASVADAAASVAGAADGAVSAATDDAAGLRARRSHRGGGPSWRRGTVHVHGAARRIRAVTEAMFRVLVVEDDPAIRDVLRTLLERNLVAIVGRAATPGRPLLYGTTKEFLKHFGLNDLADLPKPREIDELMAEAEFEVEKRMLAELEQKRAAEESGEDGDLRLLKEDE